MSPLESQHAVVVFAEGIPGFESCRQFVLLTGSGVEPFTIVQGLGPDAPAFAAIDPLRVVDGYRAELGEADRARLLAQNDAGLVWLAIISVGASGIPTANLRSPLVINPASLRGIQLIPADSAYSFEHPLRAA